MTASDQNQGTKNVSPGQTLLLKKVFKKGLLFILTKCNVKHDLFFCIFIQWNIIIKSQYKALVFGERESNISKKISYYSRIWNGTPNGILITDLLVCNFVSRLNGAKAL